MAKRNVIRQDVVQVEFEVGNLPFDDIVRQEKAIIGPTNDITDGMKDVTRSANRAGDAMSDMARDGKDIRNIRVDNLEADLRGVGSAADKAGNDLRDLGNNRLNGLQSGLKEVDNQLDEMAKSSGDLMQTLTGMGGNLAGALGVGLGAKAAFDTANDYQKSLNTLQTQTGATKAEMQEYDDVITRLYSNNMGESFDDVAKSIASVKSITGQSGKALEDMSSNALLMRDTFDFDVTESVRSADMMMKQFGISGDQAYSMIAQGTQLGLDKNGNLLDDLNEYSVHFKQLGFNSVEMMNMLANSADLGVFDIDKIGDSMKEFGIRAKEGEKSTTEIFAGMGLNAAKLTDDFAHGGEAANKAFKVVTSSLKNMKDKTAQNAAGVALFGTMWEDMGADAVLAMTNVKGEISGSTEALESISEVKYDDVGSALSALGRSVQTDLVIPLMQDIMPSIGNIANALIDGFHQFGAGFRGEAEGMLTPLGWVGAAFKVVGDIAGGTFAFITENASWAMPVLFGVAAVMGVIKVASRAAAAAEQVRALIGAGSIVVTKGATVAQWLFNTSLLACPAWLVVGGILLLCAAIGWLVKKGKEWLGLDTSKEKEMTLTPQLGGDIGADYQAQMDQMQPAKADYELTPTYTKADTSALETSVDIDPTYKAVPNTAGGKPENFGQDISGFYDSIEPAGYNRRNVISEVAPPENAVTYNAQPEYANASAEPQATLEKAVIAEEKTDYTEQTGYQDIPTYTPEKTAESITNITNNNETFNFNPTISVEIKGGSDKDLENGITVKVKKILKEEFDSMRRKYPRIIEV